MVKDLKNKLLKIIIRADSSQSIGLGHIMRCLVLAQRLKEQNYHVEIIFATQNLQGNINHKILEQNFELQLLKTDNINELIELNNQKKADLLIIDSYMINSEDEKFIKNKIKSKMLVFDDTFQIRYADIILNHGIQVNKKEYKNLVPKKSKVFAGEKFTLLRDEFFKSYKVKTRDKNVAIILGGNDTQNLSLKLKNLLKKIDKRFKISIITSSVNPHLKELQEGTDFSLLVDIANVAKVLAAQNFVICASGGNLFEVMALKVPFINIQVADNQQNIINFLNDKNIETTLIPKEISVKNLKEKIEYIFHHDIYEDLNLKFSKNHLAKKILKELQ